MIIYLPKPAPQPCDVSRGHRGSCNEKLLLGRFKWSLEKAVAPHSTTLAWRVPGTGEPGRLQSMGSHRVEHDWATSLSLFTFMHWRRKWQPTPVLLPGESQGQRSLLGCRLCGRRVRLKRLSNRSSREGNGTPLQYSCLESPRDGGACWAVFHGFAQSRTEAT